MNFSKCIHRFELYNNLVFNKQINPITTIQGNFFVHNRYGFLSFKIEAGILKFITETFFICRFKHSRA